MTRNFREVYISATGQYLCSYNRMREMDRSAGPELLYSRRSLH